MMRNLLFLILILFAANSAVAQKDEPLAIVKHIEDNSKSKVQHDNQVNTIINLYLNEKIGKIEVSTTGSYMVQVFSSNNQRTAKNNALLVERKLRMAFPSYGVYRQFSSPFWKVRIGNFKTQEEALSFQNLVKASFPEYSRETYVVRNR